MTIFRRIRFRMTTLLMFVLTTAAASALFVKLHRLTEPITEPGWRLDVPSLFLLAMALTAVALAAWKGHTPVQAMLQITITCIGCLAFIAVAEAKQERLLRYWYQATFALLVTLPILGRQYVKSTMERGPRRTWWKNTFESVFFSWLTLMLLAAGGLLQVATYFAGAALMQK